MTPPYDPRADFLTPSAIPGQPGTTGAPAPSEAELREGQLLHQLKDRALWRAWLMFTIAAVHTAALVLLLGVRARLGAVTIVPAVADVIMAAVSVLLGARLLSAHRALAATAAVLGKDRAQFFVALRHLTSVYRVEFLVIVIGASLLLVTAMLARALYS